MAGRGRRGPAAPKKSGYDWGKIIKDLHTGKIGGEAGKLFVDVVAGTIILLTLSGLYLWAVPKLRKRKAERDAAAKARAPYAGAGSGSTAPSSEARPRPGPVAVGA